MNTNATRWQARRGLSNTVHRTGRASHFSLGSRPASNPGLDSARDAVRPTEAVRPSPAA
ncbi:hypothetical protein XAPC_3408 [Xanthomonas citri pv. punicae str. LMG 859]|nr:hypothetical protein XAPC_3408 [Xanthomonas citri pv. punicae str. LMG 859]